MVRGKHIIPKASSGPAKTMSPEVGKSSGDPFTEALNLWGLDRGFRLVQSIADFYLLYSLSLDKPNVRTLVETHATTLGDQMRRYMNAASGGELRHAPSHARGWHTATLPDFITEYVRTVPGDRYRAWGRWHGVWKERGLEALEGLCRGFSLQWRGAFGGRKWRLVVENLLSYERKEVSTIIFVDTACNIEHNCGPVFNKLWDTSALRHVYRAAFNEDRATLLLYASESVKELV